MNYRKKKTKHLVWEVLWVTYALNLSVFNLIQVYVMQYFHFTLRILKLFHFLAFESVGRN